MTNRRINNLLVVLIILCSTSFFNLKALGPAEKAIDIIGIVLILVFLVLHMVYAKQAAMKHQFSVFISLIFLSFFTSLVMANYDHDQGIPQTLYAQRALFYYLFYYLLHQLRMRPRDLEWIIISFGILHGVLFLVQYMAYPKILFDTFILVDRGTIRIYLAGSDYLAICFFMSIMAFLRTNRPRYLLFMLMSFSIFVILGGRQTMALMAFVLVLAVLFSKKVKSRFGITFLIAAGVVLIFILFQPIFNEMLHASKSNTSEGSNYIRIKASQYFLTEFYNSPFAYLFGNGAPGNGTAYGREIDQLIRSQHYYLSDIGIIGLFVMYGLFFVIGNLGIIFKTLRIHFQDKYLYIKYIFIGFMLSLLTGAGFGNMDFICSVCCLLYIVDVSCHQSNDSGKPENQAAGI
jgi:hypothetical protein